MCSKWRRIRAASAGKNGRPTACRAIATCAVTTGHHAISPSQEPSPFWSERRCSAARPAAVVGVVWVTGAYLVIESEDNCGKLIVGRPFQAVPQTDGLE